MRSQQVYNKDCQKFCGIDSAQFELLKQNMRFYREQEDSEVEVQLNNILDTDQINKLKTCVIIEQTKTHGTVYSLTEGLLADELDISPTQVEAIATAAKQIQSNLNQSISDARATVLQETFPIMSSNQIEHIAEHTRSANRR